MEAKSRSWSNRKNFWRNSYLNSNLFVDGLQAVVEDLLRAHGDGAGLLVANSNLIFFVEKKKLRNVLFLKYEIVKIGMSWEEKSLMDASKLS